ncbi:endolytic transglycosylase MltG [Actinoplanes sp. RD1]|uniref:endolytic transglycosylase MltG n=1 Tax=Actinoplanes sp. RD1 TaxID=3064538 RepID=UPI002740EFDF|nr:endolytic transglycosylase MltG [Actinoplanes sp. RD1]
MIDELDQAFDDQSVDKTKSRHRRKRSGAGKTAIAFVMVFALLGVLGVGGYLGYEKVRGFFTAADYDGAGTGDVTVAIKEGSITEIGNTLVEVDVVKSTAAFIDAAEANPKGSSIQPGTYKLKKQMSAENAVAMLLNGKSRVVNGVTIKEGWYANQVFAELSKKTGVPVADFKKAAKDPEALGVPDFWFNRTDGQKVTKSIEGFLFPETYEFPPDGTAEEYLGIMVQHFLQVTDDIGFVQKAEQDRKISPYEVLTVASLAQAEAGNKDDLGKVARAAYNRLYVGSPELACKCLEYDVGINYYYQLTGKKTKPSKDMTTAELRSEKNPYRLHGKEGLTPTPINNPGKAALEGALEPPKGDWIYFVAIDKQGHSAFAATLAEHNRNIEKAKAAGIL